MLEEKFICHHCVNDNYVSKHIRSNGDVTQSCSYCHRRRKNIPLEDIFKMMNEVFNYYYDVYEDIYGTGRGESAQEVICEELGVDYEVAEDIYSGLCEEFNDYYDYHAGVYNEDFL